MSVQLPTAASIEALHGKLDHVAALLEKRAEKGSYVEPGPASPRQYFTAKELMERWDYGSTTVYEIPDFELPCFKKNGKRYFWAYVWAYEGRITREEANKIYHGSLQETDKQLLSHPPAQPSRIRRLRAGELQGAK